MVSSEQKLLNYYRNNPVAFLTDCLDVKPQHVWDKMREICDSVANNQFTCVKAGNSLSKSYTVGRLALWFLYTHNPSTVFTTAPSNIQVEDIIWREIRDAHSSAKVPLGGKVLKTSLELAEKWFATGFATKADSGESEATRVLGFHNEDMLIILDEAPGVDVSIWNAIDRLITNPRVKVLVIGNPIYATGNFVDCFKDPKFNKITVSAFDSPNYKEGKEVVPGLAGREFVKYVRNKFGEGTPQWKSMITGEIPDTDANSLIPYSAIEAVFNRTKILPTPKETYRFIVWDVADGGTDTHQIWCWENGKVIDVEELHGKTIEEAEPYVWRMLRRNKANAIVWDNDGRGRVAGGYLELSADRYTELYPFEGSSREVEDKDTFYNIRDEAHWVMRDYFIQGKIMLDKNDNLLEELTSAKEEVEKTSGPKARYIRVESKKDEKKRLGRSPDKRDNIMMACYAIEHFDITPVEKQEALYSFKRTADYSFNPMTV
jgi:phage terminase large subunit